MKTISTDTYDFIAVGLGPFNLSLACLMAPLKEYTCLFLDKNAAFDWHPGMLVEQATLQNPFLADLVSLADPTSPFSYLNYCKTQGRLYSYFLRENFYLTRREYTQYCRWACSRLNSLRFNCEVTQVHHDPDAGLYVVTGRDNRSQRRFEYRCKRLVLGVGSTPHLPACCKPGCKPGDPYLHASDYLVHKTALQARRSITIVGSGQSAAEIYLDLLRDWDRHGYTLNWITRSPRFFQMETAKLTAELLSPDYIDHFFGLPEASKARVLRSQKSVYNGINTRLINDIYELLDEKRRQRGFRTHLLANSELRHCGVDPRSGDHELGFFLTDQERGYTHRTDGLIFATGYAHPVPAFVAPLRERIRWDAQGRYLQARNYAVDLNGSEIFVQNAGCHSHGMTNPDLGLTCHRNSLLIRELTGVAYYKTEPGAAVQHFAPPTDSPLFELHARHEGVQ